MVVSPTPSRNALFIDVIDGICAEPTMSVPARIARIIIRRSVSFGTLKKGGWDKFLLIVGEVVER